MVVLTRLRSLSARKEHAELDSTTAAITESKIDHELDISNEQDTEEDDDQDQDTEETEAESTTTTAREHKKQRTKSTEAWRQFYADDSSESSDDEVMNIDKIEDLLYLAECRLQEQEKALENFKMTTTTDTTSATQALKPIAGDRLPKPYMRSSDKIVRPDPKALVAPKLRALANKDRNVDEIVSVKKLDKKKEPPAGLASHFNLPRTKVTPELKRDLQLLSMRAVLDPKRMYKRQGKFKIPEYSQVGTIVEGPTDFYGGRINRKDRQESFVKETMQAEKQSGRFKRKYDDLQTKQRSGKKAFWNARTAKRRQR